MKTMLISLSVLIVFVLVVVVFVNQPKFGKLPSGKRLERIQSSPNYQKGSFQNLSVTPDLTEGVSYSTVMWDFLFAKKERQTPTEILPSVKTDLLNLSPEADILVWLGHSSYFMQVDGKKVLMDPVLSGAATPMPFGGKSFAGSDIYTTKDFPEISIIFKPLGINRFIKDNYQSIAPNFTQEFTNSVWRHFGEDLFTGEDDLSKLESFLLSQFSENQDLIAIEESLKLLEKGNEQTTIDTIAAKVGLNLKTFQRHFNKHMGCSPIEYRRICRFRNSLNSKHNSFELKNLTDITYEEGYYDQSYFIKEFRKLTNHNPKDFFKATSKVDGDKIVWELK